MTQEKLNKKLLVAVYTDNISEVKEVLSLGADIEALNRIGNTPLMTAASFEQIEMVRFLIEHGADVNLINCNGDTALMRACWNGHTDTVQLLIEHGADISLKDKDGKTALDILQKRHPDKYSKWTEETVIRLQRERLENEDSAQESITGYEFDI